MIKKIENKIKEKKETLKLFNLLALNKEIEDAERELNQKKIKRSNLMEAEQTIIEEIKKYEEVIETITKIMTEPEAAEGEL